MKYFRPVLWTHQVWGQAIPPHFGITGGTVPAHGHWHTQQTFLIPIYPQAREIVERRLTNLPADLATRLLTFNDCRSALAGACKRLKFPHFEVRALRRYFITQALRRGVDVPTVASWQGHRDGGKLILATYADEVRLDHSLRMSKLMSTDVPANVIPIAATA